MPHVAAAATEERGQREQDGGAPATPATPAAEGIPTPRPSESGPCVEQVINAAAEFGIPAERYAAYAAKRWGPGWKINAAGRRRALAEIESFRDDPDRLFDKIDDGQWRASCHWRFENIPPGARAVFSCVPTMNKAVVVATVGATEAAEAVGEQLAAVLGGFAPANDAERRTGIPTIGVSHGMVYGCGTEHGVPMAGFDHEFTTGSPFGAGPQTFMLGHVHKHQSWEQDGRMIAYAGSIGRLHYGEQGAKGFLIWDVGATSACFEVVETPAKRNGQLSCMTPQTAG